MKATTLLAPLVLLLTGLSCKDLDKRQRMKYIVLSN